MSEYIIEQGNENKPPRLHEEIVRCRDCEFYERYDEDYLKTRTFKPIQPHCFMHGKTVKPDGFCVWASRRES